MPYPAIYQFTEAASMPGPSVNRSVLLETVDDGVIEAMRDAYESSPGVMTLFQIRVLGGAMARVPSGDTAFAHRQAPVLVFGMTMVDSPEAMPAAVAWGDEFLSHLLVKSIGVYSNFLEDEGEARVREAYPARTYRRLAALKAAWDPENVFRRNQNIRPAAAG
ncbi:MAG: BBE domain-containing protein [Chloroflexota bacterium]